MKRALLLGLLLAGCQTTDDHIASDDRQCRSYGANPGDPAYVQCRTNLDANRANVKASERVGTGSSLTGTIKRLRDD
jgi:hypothetical protein